MVDATTRILSLGLTINTHQTPSDGSESKKKCAFMENLKDGLPEVGGLDTSKFIKPELVKYSSFDGRDSVYAKESATPARNHIDT